MSRMPTVATSTRVPITSDRPSMSAMPMARVRTRLVCWTGSRLRTGPKSVCRYPSAVSTWELTTLAPSMPQTTRTSA